MELAFALPLLIMLIVGMVSAGIAYNHQLGLTHAAREGGRYAATLPVTNPNFLSEPNPMHAWLDEVASQVEDDTTGTLGTGVPGHYICVAYVYPNGTAATPTDQTTSRVDNAGALTYPSQPCFSDSRPASERRVQVRVARDSDFNVVFFSTTVTLDSEAVNRFEPISG